MPPRPLPYELTGKLAKLLPMLGSDSMGEAIAAVEAIKRALTAHDRDWHDVVAHVNHPAPFPATPNPYDPYNAPPTYPQSQTTRGPTRTQTFTAVTKDSLAVIASIDAVLQSTSFKPSQSSLKFLLDTKVRASRYDTVRFSPKQWSWYEQIMKEVGITP